MVNLETPCIIMDIETVKKNIERMQEIARTNGIALRPHTKTHKMPEVSKMQLKAGATGICVAKVSEAEVMAKNGIKDIFIAYPVIGKSKIKRIIELNKKINLIVGVESLIGAKAMAEVANENGQTIDVMLEIDTGLKRTGVPYNDAVDIASEVAKMKGLALRGIYTFHSLIHKGKPTHEREKAGLEEGQLMVSLANKMRNIGIKIKDVSVGSTPTAESVAKVSGITEIRAGTYIFNDMKQINLGTCSIEDCAVKVLTTVVSVSKNQAVIDAGSKALATDAILGVYPSYLMDYGLIENHPNLKLEKLYEEHGVIKLEEGRINLKVGDKITIIPNHICSTINLYNKIFYIEDNNVIDEIKILGRGMLY